MSARRARRSGGRARRCSGPDHPSALRSTSELDRLGPAAPMRSTRGWSTDESFSDAVPQRCRFSKRRISGSLRFVRDREEVCRQEAVGSGSVSASSLGNVDPENLSALSSLGNADPEKRKIFSSGRSPNRRNARRSVPAQSTWRRSFGRAFRERFLGTARSGQRWRRSDCRTIALQSVPCRRGWLSSLWTEIRRTRLTHDLSPVRSAPSRQSGIAVQRARAESAGVKVKGACPSCRG